MDAKSEINSRVVHDERGGARRAHVFLGGGICGS